MSLLFLFLTLFTFLYCSLCDYLCRTGWSWNVHITLQLNITFMSFQLLSLVSGSSPICKMINQNSVEKQQRTKAIFTFLTFVHLLGLTLEHINDSLDLWQAWWRFYFRELWNNFIDGTRNAWFFAQYPCTVYHLKKK